MWLNVKNEFRAIPVMIPGSAIGSTSRNDTDSRPKKRKRAIANAAAEPSTSALAVASSAARTESQIASRTSWACHATPNQCVVRPGMGQLCTFDLLNAYTMISASGIHRKSTTSAVHTPSARSEERRVGKEGREQ